eukprot:10712072-Lingulodinium_polyedra.AAC.1
MEECKELVHEQGARKGAAQDIMKVHARKWEEMPAGEKARYDQLARNHVAWAKWKNEYELKELLLS